MVIPPFVRQQSFHTTETWSTNRTPHRYVGRLPTPQAEVKEVTTSFSKILSQREDFREFMSTTNSESDQYMSRLEAIVNKENKDEWEKRLLLEFIKRLRCFEEFKWSKERLEGLAVNFSLMEYEEGQQLSKHDDMLTTLFIPFTGSLAVYDGEYTEDDEPVKIVPSFEGYPIRALLDNNKCNETIIAREKMKCITLQKIDFDRILRSITDKGTVENYNILTGMTAMKHYQKSELQEFAAFMRTFRFKKGDIIFDENDPVDNFYIVKSGKVNVELKIDFVKHHRVPVHRGGFEVQEIKIVRTVELLKLRPGSFFGEEMFFGYKERQIRISAGSDVEAIAFLPRHEQQLAGSIRTYKEYQDCSFYNKFDRGTIKRSYMRKMRQKALKRNLVRNSVVKVDPKELRGGADAKKARVMATDGEEILTQVVANGSYDTLPPLVIGQRHHTSPQDAEIERNFLERRRRKQETRKKLPISRSSDPNLLPPDNSDDESPYFRNPVRRSQSTRPSRKPPRRLRPPQPESAPPIQTGFAIFSTSNFPAASIPGSPAVSYRSRRADSKPSSPNANLGSRVASRLAVPSRAKSRSNSPAVSRQVSQAPTPEAATPIPVRREDSEEMMPQDMAAKKLKKKKKPKPKKQGEQKRHAPVLIPFSNCHKNLFELFPDEG